jgi:hypothetical protein
MGWRRAHHRTAGRASVFLIEPPGQAEVCHLQCSPSAKKHVVFPDIVNLRDVGGPELGDGFGLALKALQVFLVRRFHQALR